jgi:hypothetical protein
MDERVNDKEHKICFDERLLTATPLQELASLLILCALGPVA